MRIQRISKNIIYPELSYRICGLFFSVYKKLGRYKNEKQYADALEILLKENKIKYTREESLPPSFEGERTRRNVPDFVIDGKIILRLKARILLQKKIIFRCKDTFSLIIKNWG